MIITQRNTLDREPFFTPCWWTVNKRSLISSFCLSTSICSFHHCYLCLPRLHENHLLGKNGTNFPKQLLKLPTQRRSSLPWGPRPVPIENLNIFLFLYHQHKFIALFFSAHSTTAHLQQIRAVLLPFADQTFIFRLGKFLGTVWRSQVWSVV